MTQTKMGVVRFGASLINANDLDPVYVVLWSSGFDDSKMKRWLLAYWCFYHMGTSSWIVDQNDYWKAMETAAGSKDWPRSSERRHFRGNAAVTSVEYLKQRGIENLYSELRGTLTIQQVMKTVQSWRGFGPWIAFKVADMLERLNLCEVRFDNAAMLLFDSPRIGSELAWKLYRKDQPMIDDVSGWAVSLLLKSLGSLRAPPRYERKINVQEVETVLCKWKSYLNGHYTIGEDIESIRKGLSVFADSPTCSQLLSAGATAGLWKV